MFAAQMLKLALSSVVSTSVSPTFSSTDDWCSSFRHRTDKARISVRVSSGVEERPQNGLCGIIQGVKEGIRPRMVVHAQSLWQLEADPERNQFSSPQVQDSQFRTLRDLLRPQGSKQESSMSLMNGKDRLILSFILSTSPIHFVNGPWLQTSINSDNICFLVSNCRSSVDIRRPYLTTSFTSSSRPPVPRDLNQPHRFPDILSLGILLLEIARGAPLEFKESQDRCVVALDYMDKWVKGRQKGHSRTIPDGLYRAISACIDPNESRKDSPDKSGVRRFIFARIIYPLEDALSTAHEIQLDSLHSLYPSLSQETEGKGVGSFDHQDESQQEKLEAAKEWLQHSCQVDELVYSCQELCATETDRRTTRVKVAVLDTGLQLPEALQEMYEEEGRINTQESATFVRSAGDEGSHGWNLDQDGHGSRVGEIILRFAPSADLHVAKVFQTRADLADPSMAAEVYERIAKAITRATNDWKVDVIIMSFGFDRPIPVIRKAIDKASRIDKPSLFFAATRNDGTHKPMAWPARDMTVFGVSSTAGDGSLSTFNPSDSQIPSVLYAFGEGVPVQVADPGDPTKFTTKHVSGTSYSTPVAAAMVANLLGCIRIMIRTGSPENQRNYSHVLEDLLRIGDMLTVLKSHMQKESVSGVESLLPWDFLNVEGLKDNRILEAVASTLRIG